MPSAPLLPALAKSIDEQLRVAETAVSDPGPEGVHDLRVATRRLRAGLDLWLALHPGKKLDRSRRALQKLGRRLGSLREIDVNLSQLSELRGRNPAGAVAVEFALASETRRRKRRARDLDRELGRIDLTDLAKEIQAEVDDELDSKSEEIPLASVARKELRERIPRLATLLDHALLQPTPKSLHRLRIGLKKFRYSVELCASAYDGRRVPHLLRRLKKVQDALGLVQDANALHLRFAMLRANLRRDGLPAIERLLLAPMRAVARLARERTAAAIRQLEVCRRQAFFSKFEASMTSREIGRL